MVSSENGSRIQSPVTFNNQAKVQNQAVSQTFNESVRFVNIIQNVPSFIQSTDPSAYDNEILESLAFPQMFDRQCNVEQPHESTCGWILDLEEYQNWCKNSGLLWIKGKPGAGKSTLMAFLYRMMKDQHWIENGTDHGIDLEFFFSARGVELQRTPLGMLRSLLNQLFRQDPAIRPNVRRAYKEKRTAFGCGERRWEWQRQELEGLLQQSLVVSVQERPVTIFVDALDETGAQFASELAGYFHQVNNLVVSATALARICISSRHYPVPTSRQGVEIWVEEHNGHDITSFVNDRLDMEQLVGIDSSEQEAWHDLREDIVQQATGMFQWARLVVSLVSRKITDGESPEGIRHWLQKVPGELGSVYQYILESIIEVEYRNQSFLLFQWVCLAERPLSVTEMRYALAAKDVTAFTRYLQWDSARNFVKDDVRMKKLVKTFSGGLVEVIQDQDSQEESIQVIHQSVNDFLLAQGLTILAKLVLADSTTDNIIRQCHKNLYRSCLNYLSIEDVKITTEDSSDLQREEKQNILCQSPWLEYTAINLFCHAEKATSCRFDELGEEVKLLQQLIEKWVFIYRMWNIYPGRCPERGATLLHAASAANLINMVQHLVSHRMTVDVKDMGGNTALHYAAKSGHQEVAEILFCAGADLEAKNVENRTPLVQAVGHGHISFVKWILCKNINVNEAMGDFGSALQQASGRCSEEIVRLLLKAGANVNAQGGHYGNALQAASFGGSEEVVQMLLEAGADVNAQGGIYGNALTAAAISYYSEVEQMLLEAGADVNAQGGEHGNALQAASYRGSKKVVQMLLEAGANVNAQGGHYGNALQAAVASPRDLKTVVEVTKMLLDTGADVNAQGGEYGSALQIASYRDLQEVVQMLFNAGADVNVQGGKYGNALTAASYQGLKKVVQMLLNAGADVNAQDREYGNALHAASYRGSEEIVQMLLKAGADVNTQGGYYGNALQAASHRGSEEVVQMLLEAGADVNAQGGEHGNALQAASYQGLEKVVQMLLEAGADVNTQGGYYGNALQAASHGGSEEVVQMLLEAGADVNTQGGEYGNALQAASFGGSEEVVQMLLEAGANVNAQGGIYDNALNAASSRRFL